MPRRLDERCVLRVGHRETTYLERGQGDLVLRLLIRKPALLISFLGPGGIAAGEILDLFGRGPHQKRAGCHGDHLRLVVQPGQACDGNDEGRRLPREGYVVAHLVGIEAVEARLLIIQQAQQPLQWLLIFEGLQRVRQPGAAFPRPLDLALAARHRTCLAVVCFEFGQIAGRQPHQVVEIHVDVLDGDEFREAHWGKLLAQVGLPFNQSPEQKKDIQDTFDLARIAAQAQRKHLDTPFVRQLPGNRMDVPPHRFIFDRGQDEGKLDDLLQVLARLDLAAVTGLYGSLNGLWIQSQHEDAARRVEKQLQRFKHLDRLVRRAPVEVVDEHHQLIWLPCRLSQGQRHQAREVLAKLLERAKLRLVAGQLLMPERTGQLAQLAPRLTFANLLARSLQPVGRHASGRQRIAQHRHDDIGGEARTCAYRLGPVRPQLALFRPRNITIKGLAQMLHKLHCFNTLGLRRLLPGLDQRRHVIQQNQQEGAPQRVLLVVGPCVEPHGGQGSRLWVPGAGHPVLHLHHQAGLARAPAAEHAQGQRRLGVGIQDDPRERLDIPAEIKLVCTGRPVVDDR